MAISYFWTINPLECYPTSSQGPDYVFTAHWQLHATEEYEGTTYTATSIGTQGVPMNTGSFIPFEELTLPVVQGWVEDSMGPDQVESYKAGLAQQIANQINPPVVTLTSPWLTTTSTTTTTTTEDPTTSTTTTTTTVE
jgi:hypothetical protein